MFDCNPVITSGEEAPVAKNPPGLDVILYDVIVEPPLPVGKSNATDAEALLIARDVPVSVATRFLGGCGNVAIAPHAVPV